MSSDNRFTHHSEDLDSGRNGAGASKSQIIDHVISQVRARLEEISTSQEELAEARERLLVERESLNSSGKLVHAQRVRTGNAEVAFMNALRKFFHKQGFSFPPELTAGYEAVEEERTKLGEMEEDHLQTERSLGGAEWSFGEKENDFYQFDLRQAFSSEFFDSFKVLSDPVIQPAASSVLLSDPVPPSDAIQYRIAVIEHKRLLKRFEFLRHSQMEVLAIEESWKGNIPNAPFEQQRLSNFVGLYGDLLKQITDCEVRIQRLKANLPYEISSSTRPSRRFSESNIYGRRQLQSDDMISKAHSESAALKLSEDVSIKQRIRDWLLDCLKHSVIERTHYLNILHHHLEEVGLPEPDAASWEELAVQYWPFDMTEEDGQFGSTQHVESFITTRQISSSQMKSILQQEDINELHTALEESKVERNSEANSMYRQIPRSEDVTPAEDIVPRIQLLSDSATSKSSREGQINGVGLPDEGLVSPSHNSHAMPPASSIRSMSRSRSRSREPVNPVQQTGDRLHPQSPSRVDSAHTSDSEISSRPVSPCCLGCAESNEEESHSCQLGAVESSCRVPSEASVQSPRRSLCIPGRLNLERPLENRIFHYGTHQGRPRLRENHVDSGRLMRPISLPPDIYDNINRAKEPTVRRQTAALESSLTVPQHSPHRRSSSLSDISRRTSSSSYRQDSLAYSFTTAGSSLTPPQPKSPTCH